MRRQTETFFDFKYFASSTQPKRFSILDFGFSNQSKIGNPKSEMRRPEGFLPRNHAFRTSAARRSRLVACLALGCILVLLPAAAAPTPRIVMFLGNSITAGYGIELSQAFPALIQERIDAKGWNVKVINAGQSGDTSAGGLSRLDWVLRNKIDVLVLELGANDGLRGLPVEVTQKNLQAIINRTKERYPNVKVIVAGMKVPPNIGRDYARNFEAIFPELAKQNNAALIPFILQGVGGERALNLPDGIHPTTKGHEIVAANVWKVLEPVLRSLNTGR